MVAATLGSLAVAFDPAPLLARFPTAVQATMTSLKWVPALWLLHARQGPGGGGVCHWQAATWLSGLPASACGESMRRLEQPHRLI